jgi:parvulin-like peptidyl-prolyl isomerase
MHPTAIALLLTAPPLMTAGATPPAPAAGKEPDHITIQHVLIGFKGSVPGKNITRTQDEAKKLAEEILARAKKGENFDDLVKQYTDDAAPGIYSMSNKGVAPSEREYPRERMVPAFGDAGFPLQVGELGMASYDKVKSPYGWHIVKRLK